MFVQTCFFKKGDPITPEEEAFLPEFPGLCIEVRLDLFLIKIPGSFTFSVSKEFEKVLVILGLSEQRSLN